MRKLLIAWLSLASACGSSRDGTTDAPSHATLEEIDLGIIGSNVPVTFQVPANTLGFTLYIEGHVGEALGVFRLTAPNGNDVIDDFAIVPGSGQLNTAGMDDLVVAIPQSDAVPGAFPPEPGAWTITLRNANAPTDAHVWLYLRRTLDGTFGGGTVAVNVYASPGAGVSEAYMEMVLADAFTSFGGLTLGPVTFSSISSSYDVIDLSDELKELVATSTSSTTPAFNLFVVRDFADLAFPQSAIMPEAMAGLPGAAVRQGTKRSGIVIVPSHEKVRDGSLVAHVLGHFVGLWHTSHDGGAEGLGVDPLSDTPECTTAMLMTSPASCPDADNLMFPILVGGRTLTPRQLAVVHGSALYVAP